MAAWCNFYYLFFELFCTNNNFENIRLVHITPNSSNPLKLDVSFSQNVPVLVRLERWKDIRWRRGRETQATLFHPLTWAPGATVFHAFLTAAAENSARLLILFFLIFSFSYIYFLFITIYTSIFLHELKFVYRYTRLSGNQVQNFQDR